jgi:hypothetical protein
MGSFKLSENWKIWKQFPTKFSPISEKHCYWKVPRLGPFVLLVKTTCRWRWVWSIGGVILTGETETLGEKPDPVSIVVGLLNFKPGDMYEVWRYHSGKAKDSALLASDTVAKSVETKDTASQSTRFWFSGATQQIAPGFNVLRVR